MHLERTARVSYPSEKIIISKQFFEISVHDCHGQIIHGRLVPFSIGPIGSGCHDGFARLRRGSAPVCEIIASGARNTLLRVGVWLLRKLSRSQAEFDKEESLT